MCKFKNSKFRIQIPNDQQLTIMINWLIGVRIQKFLKFKIQTTSSSRSCMINWLTDFKQSEGSPLLPRLKFEIWILNFESQAPKAKRQLQAQNNKNLGLVQIFLVPMVPPRSGHPSSLNPILPAGLPFGSSAAALGCLIFGFNQKVVWGKWGWAPQLEFEL